MGSGSFAAEIETARCRLQQVRDTLPHPPTESSELLDRYIAQLDEALEELRVAEEELRQQNEELVETRNEVERERRRYRDLFETAPCPYVTSDRHGTIQQGNKAAAALLGAEPKRLIGRPLVLYVYQPFRTQFREQLSALLMNREPLSWETQLAPRDAPLPAEVAITARPIDAGDGTVSEIRWMLLDLSEHRRLAARLRVMENAWGRIPARDAETQVENERLRVEVVRLRRELESARPDAGQRPADAEGGTT